MAAATATAEVSEPPRPSVVMWPCSSMPLKAGDDHHFAGSEVGTHALVVDGFDAGLGVGAVGADGHLPAGVAHRLHAFGLQRDGQQGGRSLFAGGGEHVEFAVVGGGGARGERGPWPGRAGGWSRRSWRWAPPPSGGPPVPTWRRAWRHCGCAPWSPSMCRRICERSMPLDIRGDGTKAAARKEGKTQERTCGMEGPLRLTGPGTS